MFQRGMQNQGQAQDSRPSESARRVPTFLISPQTMAWLSCTRPRSHTPWFWLARSCQSLGIWVRASLSGLLSVPLPMQTLELQRQRERPGRAPAYRSAQGWGMLKYKGKKGKSNALHQSMAALCCSPPRTLPIKNRGRWRFLQPAEVFGHRLPEAGKLLDLFMATCQGLSFPTLSYSLKFAVL